MSQIIKSEGSEVPIKCDGVYCSYNMAKTINAKVYISQHNKKLIKESHNDKSLHRYETRNKHLKAVTYPSSAPEKKWLSST